MTRTPLVSIIIPVYNVDKFLPRCLDSICNQTYSHLEIILVDNAANKKCKEICAAYAAKDKRILLITLGKNVGPAGARQAGLAHATGDFLAFVDADDWLPVQSYEILVECQQKTGADVVWGSVEYHQPDKAPFYLDLFPNTREKDLERMPPHTMIVPQRMYCWDKLYARHLLQKGLHFNTAYQGGEDIDFAFQAVQLANFVTFTKQIVYCYFIHPNSTTHAPGLKKCQDVLGILQEIDDFSQRHHLPNKSACRDQLVGQKCTTLMGILLYDSKNNYLHLLRQLLSYLNTHKWEIFSNQYIGTPGKCFMMFPLTFPRLARELFRLPGLQAILHRQFCKRLLPPPEGKNN